MKIAVIIDQGVETGGGFQQALSLSLLLNKFGSKTLECVYLATQKNIVSALKKYGLAAFYFEINLVHKVYAKLSSNRIVQRILTHFKFNGFNKFDRLLNRLHIDLIYFTTPTSLAQITQTHNYVFTVLDLCHRDFPEFPEIRRGGVFDVRDNLYSQCTPRAVCVVTDSEIGRQNLIRRYNLDAKRVRNLAFLPSAAVQISEDQYQRNYIDIKKRFNIPGNYIFYPAQLWPHKNHVYILDGLKMLSNKHGIRLNALFSGSDKGNLKHVLAYADRINIRDQIFYIGYVSDNLIPYLYRQSIALVMPTYFGPTNIPPLEAFALGVPVLYSDLESMRDQVGDAALFMDLSDPGSMVQHLLRLMHDPDLKADLIRKGKERLSSLSEKNHRQVLKKIFDDYALIRHREEKFIRNSDRSYWKKLRKYFTDNHW
jgi:glycosyltransferase involved in cell wall biosynthesis